jgi:hypothetical protein
MYLVYVLRDLAGGRLSLGPAGAAAGLPKGLTGYYQQRWSKMRDSDGVLFATRQRPVLCFLAISLEPVTLMQLADWTQLEPGDVGAVLADWREFLNTDGGPPEHFRIYHDRLASAARAKIPGFLS